VRFNLCFSSNEETRFSLQTFFSLGETRFSWEEGLFSLDTVGSSIISTIQGPAAHPPLPSLPCAMRIAIYSHSIAPSIDGVCRRFTGILHELSRSQHQSLLFTLESDPQDIPIDTKVVTIDHMVFPSYPEKKVTKPTLRSFQAIMKALKEFRPQVTNRFYPFRHS
jgi:hypothetical protein